MNILFVHEIDWLKKVVFEIHTLSELLSLFGHNVYVVDYESLWKKDNFWDFVRWRTREVKNVNRAYPNATVTLRSPGLIKIPGISRFSAMLYTECAEIRRTIIEKKIDVIVLYAIITNSWQTVYLAKKYDVPIIFRSIDAIHQMVTPRFLSPLYKMFERHVYTNVDYTLALTTKMSQYVVDLGADPSKVELCLIPVDTDLFRPAPDTGELRQKWGLDKDDKVILFVGTLFNFSGLDTLIQKFPEVLREVPEARLLIVGDGLQRPKLEKIINDMGLQQQVIITGYQPYDTMPRYINMSTFCINTFVVNGITRDIYPTKIAQYLACAKAVVATRLPGMVTVIAGEEQGVVYCDDAAAMPPKIIALLKSPEHRKRLGKAGLAYATQKHSNEKIARQLEYKLAEAVKEKHKRK